MNALGSMGGLHDYDFSLGGGGLGEGLGLAGTLNPVGIGGYNTKPKIYPGQ